MALTDSSVHKPPVGVTQDYNGTPFSDLPGSVGGSYVDSVFGETVRRMTNIGAAVLDSDIYAHHWANADGTMCFTERSGGLIIANTTTGAVIRTGVPEGNRATSGAGTSGAGDTWWHPTDPDKYFYYSTTQLKKYSVATNTSTTVRDFTVETGGVNVGPLGGTADPIDATGQYIIVSISNFYRVYDITNNILYTGNVPPASGGGWGGMTPSGKYIISAFPQLSFAINHVAHSVNTTGVQFWNLGGDHSIPMTCSDGKDYCIVFEATDEGGIYLADVTVDVSAMTNAAQRAAQKRLLLQGFNGDGGHFSATGRGANQDWAFWSSEQQNASGPNADQFNVYAGAGWVAYRSEVCAINVITGVIRRLAHHRSRALDSTTNQYGYQPRISSSWDGSLIMWASNMNDSTPAGTGDIYLLPNPTGSSGGGTPTVPSANIPRNAMKIWSR